MSRYKIILFFLFVLSLPCFAGGLKGNFIDDETIGLILFFIILIHVFSLIAYYSRVPWLRIVCGIVYLPVFAIPLFLSVFADIFIILIVPPLIFYALVIGRKRK